MRERKYYIFEWLIYLISYALVLLIASYLLPNNLYIDNSKMGLYAILATLIISTLNVSIKPLLVLVTLPITAITLGLFYPVINVIILKITDFILGNHFYIKGFFMSFIVAIIISLLNKIIEESIIKPVLKGRD